MCFIAAITTESVFRRLKYSKYSVLHDGFCVIFSTIDDWNPFKQTPAIQAGSTYHLELFITQSSFKIVQDGVIAYESNNYANHQVYSSVPCYVGDPWWPAANVTISDIIITKNVGADEGVSTITQQPTSSPTMNNLNYQFVSTQLTWLSAEYHCQNEFGGTLVTIKNEEINVHVASLCDDTCWIGLRRYGLPSDSTGPWQWMSNFRRGLGLPYANWATGEPNDEAEECVELKTSWRGTWNDAVCFNGNSFVCEYPKTLTPTNDPTNEPTIEPTGNPTIVPTEATMSPTRLPTVANAYSKTMQAQYKISNLTQSNIEEINLKNITPIIERGYVHSSDDLQFEQFHIYTVNHIISDHALTLWTQIDFEEAAVGASIQFISHQPKFFLNYIYQIKIAATF